MSNKYIKTDVEGLVKDEYSGAILNVDNEKLKAYKKQKQAAQRLDKVENDINEIKHMLQQLLKR
jgi:hypothetical protein